MKSALRRTLRAWQAVTLVAALEVVLAWIAARIALGRALAPLAAHPDPARALFDHGTRGALDLGLHHAHALVSGAAVLVVVAMAWLVGSLAFAGVLPLSLAEAPRVGLARIVRGSIACTPRALALLCIARIAQGLSLALAAGCVALTVHLTRAVVDVRLHDLLCVAAAAPGLLFAAWLAAVHDAALVASCARSMPVVRALRAAWRVLRAAQLRTIAIFLVRGAADSALLALGFAVGRGPCSYGGVVALVIVVRACDATARVAVRAAWLAAVGGTWLDASTA